MNNKEKKSNSLQNSEFDISHVSDINYKQLYQELYGNVAKMLVENREYNWHPQVLSMKWDNLRK